MRLRLPLQRLGIAGATMLVVAACAHAVEDPPEAEILPSFTVDSGVVSDGLCVSTDCPAPWTTCPGSGLCKVDTRHDDRNCGACGVRCKVFARIDHASSVCSEGKCTYGCEGFFADCNHDPKDGCETPTLSDPKNCGGCGIDCADAGGICFRGACGCPNGFVQCGNDCVQIETDDLNCGACGSVCKAPDDGSDPRWTCGANIQPPHTKWKCGDSACTMQCEPQWGDCNHQFCGDGCETDLLNDRNNCGGCGHACNQGQDCVLGQCLCDGGTRCGNTCVDLQNDPLNCGGCGLECPGPSPSKGGGPACVAGQCVYVCNPGWDDCDNNLFDGCETNLNTDSLHCGSCKNKCKGGTGQPCVEGKCLTKECDEAGVVR